MKGIQLELNLGGRLEKSKQSKCLYELMYKRKKKLIPFYLYLMICRKSVVNSAYDI